MDNARAVTCLSCWFILAGCSAGGSPSFAPKPHASRPPAASRQKPLVEPGAYKRRAAFMPKLEGCVAPYEEVHGTCVHVYYRARTEQAELEWQLALYRRGAVSPRVDGSLSAAASQEAVLDLTWLDPAALTPEPSKTPIQEARGAEEDRVKALDDVLTTVRESVVTARLSRLPSAPSNAQEAASESGSSAQRESSELAKVQTDQSTVAGAPDDTGEPTGTPTEASLAGAPERELGLAEAREGDSARASFQERLAQIRQIQTLLQDIPVEQRAGILRRLESRGARAAVGDDTWNELLTRPAPE